MYKKAVLFGVLAFFYGNIYAVDLEPKDVDKASGKCVFVPCHHHRAPVDPNRGTRPTQMLDGTAENPEPSDLAKWHAKQIERCFFNYMPKNEEEMKYVLFLYEKDKELAHEFLHSTANYIGDEICARCEYGNLFFVDKFLEHFENFMQMATSEKYSEMARYIFLDDRDGFLLANRIQTDVRFWEEDDNATRRNKKYMAEKINEIFKKYNFTYSDGKRIWRKGYIDPTR